MDLAEQLVDTWHIHNRINLYLLDAIAPEYLVLQSASKGRNAGEQFAHMHNVRLMWLKVAAPELMTNLPKIEKDGAQHKQLLAQALSDSGAAIATLLAAGLEAGKIKGFKPHPAAFLGYLVSHESHHRGQVMLIMKQSGHPVDQKTQYGLWEWGVR